MGTLTFLIIIIICQYSYIRMVTINTKLGQIRGVQDTVLNGTQTVVKFLKIPYAKPPLQQLRFAKPETYGSWNNILNATLYGPSCPQFIKEPYASMLPNNQTSEDCLTLNVYVPFQVTSSSNRPVMIFIHGGRYIQGQGMIYDGSILAIKGEVIVVTINYRLGVFGLLTTGDSFGPGNLGLWDQKLAIQWVKDNIDSYGGNPNVITLFGQGAGSASVTLQALHPSNRGLFQKIIAQSGAGTSPEYFTEKEHMVNISRQFAKTVGCDNGTTTSTGILQCIRILSAPTLLQHSFAFVNPKPFADGDFLTDYPADLLTDKKSPSYSFFRSLDFMGGTNDADGSLLLDDMVPVTLQTKYNFNIHRGLPIAVLSDVARELSELYYQNNSKITSAIIKRYTTTSTDVKVQGSAILNLISDFYFNVGSRKLLDIHSEGNGIASTFAYLFKKRNSHLSSMNAIYPWIDGAPNGHELIYLFGIEDLREKFGIQDYEDVAFANKMMELWGNFAKRGTPDITYKEWPKYDKERYYLELGPQITTKSDLYKDRLDFWETGIDQILNPIPLSAAALLHSNMLYTICALLCWTGINFLRHTV